MDTIAFRRRPGFSAHAFVDRQQPIGEGGPRELGLGALPQRLAKSGSPVVVHEEIAQCLRQSPGVVYRHIDARVAQELPIDRRVARDGRQSASHVVQQLAVGFRR